MKVLEVKAVEFYGRNRTDGQGLIEYAAALEILAENLSDPASRARAATDARAVRKLIGRGDKAASRDREIALLVRHHFHHARTPNAATVEVHIALTRYSGHGVGSPYRQHRAAMTRPLGALDSALHDLLALTDGVVPSEKTIRNAITRSWQK